MSQDLLGPIGLSLVLQAIRVLLGIELLKEFEAYDAVVGGFVCREAVRSDGGILSVYAVDFFGVKYLIDAVQLVRLRVC